MSNNLVSAGISFGQIISDALSAFTGSSPTKRAVDNLVPHISTQEIHRDELQITQHPVETGTPVTDHAFMQPFTVEMHVAWSDATAQSAGYVKAIYRALLKVQSSRIPIGVTTGKRIYRSMLIKSVMVNTDPENEYALSVVVLVQQIVITNTQTTSANADTGQHAGVTDGAANVGTGGPGKPGELGPSTTFDNGIGTIPPGSIMSGSDFSWLNDTTGAGAVNLGPADPSAPTVESLTARGGV